MRESSARSRAILLSVVASSLGCSDTTGPSGPRLEIAVAPLSLPGVLRTCFDLEVKNGAQTVWDQDHVCSDQYGNAGGGDISYVGTCDASATSNDVFLILQDIETSSGYLDELGDPSPQPSGHPGHPAADGDPDFVNPCPDARPCQLTVACNENEDSSVEFNLTVMRDAEQGFFDVAVNFEDLFCSAKVDCEYADGGPIHLLFDPAADPPGPRRSTMVAAFACTGGAGAQTTLHMDELAIECQVTDLATVVYPIDPTRGPGNSIATQPPLELWYDGALVTDPDILEDVPSLVFEVATYWDKEQLEPWNKGYWNVAIGVDPEALDGLSNCRLIGQMTASDGMLAGGATPWHSTYPVIEVDVDLGVDEDGELDCGQNPLNGDGSGVFTRYTGMCPEIFGSYFDPHFDLTGNPPEVGQHDFSEADAPPGGIIGRSTTSIFGDGYAFATQTDSLFTAPPSAMYEHTIQIGYSPGEVPMADPTASFSLQLPPGVVAYYRFEVFDEGGETLFARTAVTTTSLSIPNIHDAALIDVYVLVWQECGAARSEQSYMIEASLLDGEL